MGYRVSTVRCPTSLNQDCPWKKIETWVCFFRLPLNLKNCENLIAVALQLKLCRQIHLLQIEMSFQSWKKIVVFIFQSWSQVRSYVLKGLWALIWVGLIELQQLVFFIWAKPGLFLDFIFLSWLIGLIQLTGLQLMR